MRIVFLGTPEFAVTSLQHIFNSKHQVVGVVTMPDKPMGRGKKLGTSAVKQFALDHNIPILQPENLKDPVFLENLKSLDADIHVVVAFRMLPELVWNMPPRGTINLHGSLLPQYRGAAPINRAIMNGEQFTGVTTFQLQQKIDTGAIIGSRTIAISNDMTAGELHDIMKEEGAALLVETLNEIENDTTRPIEQIAIASSNLKAAPKIFKEDCKIDWSKPAHTIHNHIRGLSPFPGAWTTMNDIVFKILKSKTTNRTSQTQGHIITEGDQLFVGTADKMIEILEIQMQGKRRMTSTEFLRGYSFDINAYFSS